MAGQERLGDVDPGHLCRIRCEARLEPVGVGEPPGLQRASMAVASSASQFSSWASARRVTVSRQASRWVSRSRALP